jgi:hypothetical protein
METFVWLLACAGLTFIIVHATIMDKLKIRPFLQKFSFKRDLIKCALCTGVYVSAFYSFLYFPIKMAPLLIFSGAIFSFLIERILILVDENVIKLEKEKD